MNSNNYSNKYLKSINKGYTKYHHLINFLIIGGGSTFLDIGILIVLKYFYPNDAVYPFGIAISIANCFSFTISSFFNFFANKSLNFKNKDDRVVEQFGHFFVIGLVGLVINSIVFGVLHQNLNMGIVVSKLIAALIVVCWSFPANKLLTFGQKFNQGV